MQVTLKYAKNNMKKYTELFTVNIMNIGALFFANNLPGITIVENYCKVLVLLATLVYTIVKIVMLIKNIRQNKIPKNLE